VFFCRRFRESEEYANLRNQVLAHEHRTRKTVTTSLPPEELVALDRVRKARQSHPREQALREAIRRYVSQNSDRKIPVDDALSDEIEAIEEGQARFPTRERRNGGLRCARAVSRID
jgi:hypothetical protein